MIGHHLVCVLTTCTHLWQRQVVAHKSAPPQEGRLRQHPAQQRVRRLAAAGSEQLAECGAADVGQPAETICLFTRRGPNTMLKTELSVHAALLNLLRTAVASGALASCCALQPPCTHGSMGGLYLTTRRKAKTRSSVASRGSPCAAWWPLACKHACG